MNQSTSTQLATIDQLLKEKRPVIIERLAGGMSFDVFQASVSNEIRMNPELRKCDGGSVLNAMIEAGAANCKFGGPLPEAYLIPYGRECKCVFGFRALLKFTRGSVQQHRTEIVREGDTFQVGGGLFDAEIVYRRSDDPKRHEKPVLAVFAAFKMNDGSVLHEVMTFDEIEKHKQQNSPSWKKGPWSTHWEAMARKTVVMRLIRRGEIPVHESYGNDNPTDLVTMSPEVFHDVHGVLEQTPPVEPATEDVHELDEAEPDDSLPGFERQLICSLADACKDIAQCDARQNELLEMKPEKQRQEIYDIFEARRREITTPS